VAYQSAAGATPDAFGAGIAVAQQGLAKQIESTGDMLAKHALKMQEDANVTSAEKLFLDQDIKLGGLTEQYNSLQGSARVNALPKFQEDARALREEGLKSSPNPDVQKKFDQLFTRQLGFSVKAAGRESASAFRADQKATSAAVVANSMSNIAKNGADDAQFLSATGNALESQRALPEYQGASDEVKKYMDETIVSGAWTTRLQSMAKTDPLRARDLFEQNKGSMDGVSQLKLKDVIDQQIMNRQTRIDSDKIIQSGATISPELKTKVKKEEGYRETPYWDYKQTTSGYGTKAQAGDADIPPEQRRAIYEQRLDTELGRAASIVDNFAPGLPKGTRDALIDLTFNAGQTWTSQGLGQAIRAGDDEKAKAAFSQYVNAGGAPLPVLERRRAKFLAEWGGEARDSDPVSQLGTALEKAKEQAIKVFPNEPANQAQYLDKLQNQIKTDYNILRGAATDMQLQTRNIVQSELFNPDHHVTSYDQLSPKAQQAYDQAPPALQQSFQKSMRQNATADVPLTNARQDQFDALRGEATSPRTVDKFVARDLNDVDLPRAQKSILKKLQDDKKALIEKGTKMQPYMNSMRADLNDAQIGESRNDTARNEEYNKFRGVYETAIQQFETEKKRPPNEQEGREIGRKLLKDVVTSPGVFWNSSDRAYRVINDKTPIANPAGEDAEAFNKHYEGLPRGATYIDPKGTPRVKQ
jgi:GH24 family phage-related lysozyme (muramidase)